MMARRVIQYDRALPVPVVAREGIDPDTPLPGFYRMRLVSGGVFVGIRIWHGAPLDPDTGDVLDRSPRWQAQANGRLIDLERAWPRCATNPVSSQEYAHLSAQQRWGEQHDPGGAVADPTKPADPLSTPLMF